MRKLRWGVLLAVTAATALVVASQVAARTDTSAASPIKIGISLPLTGNFSEPGQAAQDGYKLWAQLINKKGGLLGRQVQLVIRDDASDQNTIVSDYNRLISQDRVDLLLGTFSSLLNLPASSVAERARMVFVAPAGGSPALFARHYHYYFFAQQATAPHQGDLFSAWVKKLPASQRPATVAYPSLIDPFAQPVVNGIRTRLEALGIKTVYTGTYPGSTTDFDTIAAQIKASGADAVVSGATFEDGTGLIRSFMKIGYNPKFLFQTTAPTEGSEFANAIGAANTNGIMTAISYAPGAKGPRFPQNHEFLVAYEKSHKGQLPAEDAADAFASAQVLEAAVKGTKGFNQDDMANWLHSHVVRTILGPLSWTADGAPRQAFFLMQWQKNRPAIISPKYLAQAKSILFPKPTWK